MLKKICEVFKKIINLYSIQKNQELKTEIKVNGNVYCNHIHSKSKYSIVYIILFIF